MACLWDWCFLKPPALLVILLCIIFPVARWNAAAFNVTFEEQEAFEWKSPPDSQFQILSGMDTYRDRRYPKVDATLGTRRGKYVAAVGTPQSGRIHGSSPHAERVLYSACLNPTGPKCALHFHTWMPASHRKMEKLNFVLLRFCRYCSQGQDSRGTVDLPYVVRNVLASQNNASSIEHAGWIHHRVELGAIHSLFVLAIVASVPDSDSVVAIDGIFQESCGLDLEKEVCDGHEFRCPHTTQCIPRNKLCDLVEDCECGEDESLPQCEHIPSGGQAQFRDCDFASGQCYWYNVPPSDLKSPVPWTLGTGDSGQKGVRLFENTPVPYVYVSPSGLQSQWTSSVLRSVDFPALTDADGLCAVRFQYWLSGDPKLTIQLLQLGGVAVRTLWQSSDAESNVHQWRQAVVVINKESVPRSYVLQMTVKVASGYRKSAAAVTNITLSPDCFDRQSELVLNLSTCGAEGREGPSTDQCAQEYGGANNVSVLIDEPFTGAQVWTVPASDKYSVQAYGAKGGRDKEGTDSVLTYGSHVQAKFTFNKGDRLLVVVGQKGQDSLQMNAVSSVQAAHASGGGGGGATFVYRWVTGKEPQLLVMAGGGGGLDFVSFADNSTDVLPLAKGGWESEDDVKWASMNTANITNFFGQGCSLASGAPLLSVGGFGAGHGSCFDSGGHGGGADVSKSKDSVVSAGQHGRVYVHQDQLYASFRHRSHSDHGRLEVLRASWRCPCDYLCIWKQPELLDPSDLKIKMDDKVPQAGVFDCICPRGRVLAANGLSCLSNDSLVDTTVFPADSTEISKQENAEPGQMSVEPIRQMRKPQDKLTLAGTVVIISIGVVLIILVTGFFIYVKRAGSQDRLWSLRLLLTRCLRNRSQLLPLHTLPACAMPARVMHINPNYSFINSKASSEHKLPEIPRDNLRMASQLGQGAFGEVYKGFLSGVSGTEREVPVAVKTLPTLHSEQTELDFLMEAFIISKFHHPNIVHFLGVCFEQHPRYIVLELLEGGSLKSFLRESRPSQGQMSKLNVGDLMALAKDVCMGCCYLEEHHFIHRDIAARNCLLTSKAADRVAKIADFGMSRDVYRADYYKKEGRALLPLKWMPPEAFMEGMFTSKTDVWSYGVVLWEIFTMGYMPYPALSNTEVMNFVYIGGRLDCPEGCPPSVYDLMLSCWKLKAEDRPSFHFINQTLENICQDTATMSQHLPAFRLPHLQNGCNGRNLKLLNHPVPGLGLNFHLDPAPCTLSPEPACTEPLLKPAPYRHSLSSGQSPRLDGFGSKRCPSPDSDEGVMGKELCSSQDPLLPAHNNRSVLDTDIAVTGQTGADQTRDLWDVSSQEADSGPPTDTEKRIGQRVKLPPLGGHRCDRLVSVSSSLSTLEEQDELLVHEDGKNTV